MIRVRPKKKMMQEEVNINEKEERRRMKGRRILKIKKLKRIWSKVMKMERRIKEGGMMGRSEEEKEEGMSVEMRTGGGER